MEFLEFPDDGGFWCIKWIDGYRQAHALSRSSSIEILFQEIPVVSATDLSRFSASEVATLLRKPRESVSKYQRGRVHVGSLPALRIGQVFRAKQIVGTLPTKMQPISLAQGELSGTSVSCGEELLRPKGWDMPFRVLNPVQFHLPRDFSASRCWLFHDRRIPADIVIPRTLIEQTFYYPHTAIANAFAAGPWSKIKQNLIHFGELDSGLRTQIDAATGEWHLILNTRVPDPYAPLMALLHFEKQASHFAEAIYTQALQDRGSNQHAPWYASGRIPLPAGAQALRMHLRGYWLADVARKGSRTFLATHIAAYDWPPELPMIAWERLNSGAGSNQPKENEGLRPYAASNSSIHAAASTKVTAQHDASPQHPALACLAMNTAFLCPPKIRKLEKASHQHYTASPPQMTTPSQEQCASSGADSYQNDAVRKALIESLLIPGVVHFNHLLAAFEHLESGGIIDHYNVFEPEESSLRTDRQGIGCWNFLSEQMRLSGAVPGRGWVILKRTAPKGSKGSRSVARAALVLKFNLGGRVALWIEIERRPTEASMLSPVLFDVPSGMEYLVIEHSLQAIAGARGSGLRREIPVVAECYPYTDAYCYQHAYDRAKVEGHLKVKGLKTTSLTNFMSGCFRKARRGEETQVLEGDRPRHS